MNLLTRHDVAKVLKIGVSTVDKLVRQKKIPVVRFNRRVLFRQEDVEAFINSHLEGQKEKEANNNEFRN